MITEYTRKLVRMINQHTNVLHSMKMHNNVPVLINSAPMREVDYLAAAFVCELYLQTLDEQVWFVEQEDDEWVVRYSKWGVGGPDSIASAHKNKMNACFAAVLCHHGVKYDQPSDVRKGHS